MVVPGGLSALKDTINLLSNKPWTIEIENKKMQISVPCTFKFHPNFSFTDKQLG